VMKALTVLSTTGLGKRYRGNWALKDCSLSVPAGRVVALVGPNGAGKTTLLHSIVGLLSPDEGNVTVLGRPAGTRETPGGTPTSPRAGWPSWRFRWGARWASCPAASRRRSR
jgi:ABC-type sugar transport system ATPase subunit